MPQSTEVRETLGFKLDEARSSLCFERELATTPEEAFAAWTDPRQVRSWWDPTGVPLSICNIDLRVGGKFEFASSAHADRPFSGTYLEISPPDLLVFHAFGATGRVTLERITGGTLMNVEIQCTGPEHLRQFVDMGVASGTSQTLDNLVDHLSG